MNALPEESLRPSARIGESVTERAAHRDRLMSPIIALALEAADRAATMFGVEPRYPFFDRQLAEFCLALPSDQKLKNGWTRLVLRRAMEGVLPADVQWRGGKSDLGPNFVRRLTSGRDRIEAVVSRSDKTVDAYIDRRLWREAYSRCREGAGSADAVAVWRGFVFTQWLQSGPAS
jgi:asparagine synthase (glutamine-hydrolysing)